MKFVRRHVLAIAACAAVTATLVTQVRAADWPTRAVTILVPTAAGGNTDLMARLAAEHLAAKFGQPFIVENKPSAGGALASGLVANAAPDGYTMMFSPGAVLLLTPLVQKLPFDPLKALVPVTNVGTGAQVIAIKRDLPVKNLAEFIAYAKANPGKLNFAIAGAQNLSHLAPVQLFKMTGIELVMVPSRGEPQAVSDLIAGNVDFYFGNASILRQYANHERIRLIAVGTTERIASMPDLPTAGETVPGFAFSSWNGFSVPAGTPEEIITKLRNEVAALVKSPEVSKRLTNLGIIPGGMSKEENAAFLKKDRENLVQAVKAAGIQSP
jgi:tripartite-type tricarboxylate transporter receptor subunit TctC